MGSPKGTVTESDCVSVNTNQLLFYHRNPEQTVFDVVVAQQGMNEVKSQMMNPLKNLTFGGTLFGENLEFVGTTDDVYAGTDYRAGNSVLPKQLGKNISALCYIQTRQKQ